MVQLRAARKETREIGSLRKTKVSPKTSPPLHIEQEGFVTAGILLHHVNDAVQNKADAAGILCVQQDVFALAVAMDISTAFAKQVKDILPFHRIEKRDPLQCFQSVLDGAEIQFQKILLLCLISRSSY